MLNSGPAIAVSTKKGIFTWNTPYDGIGDGLAIAVGNTQGRAPYCIRARYYALLTSVERTMDIELITNLVKDLAQ